MTCIAAHKAVLGAHKGMRAPTMALGAAKEALAVADMGLLAGGRAQTPGMPAEGGPRAASMPREHADSATPPAGAEAFGITLGEMCGATSRHFSPVPKKSRTIAASVPKFWAFETTH